MGVDKKVTLFALYYSDGMTSKLLRVVAESITRALQLGAIEIQNDPDVTQKATLTQVTVSQDKVIVDGINN